MHLSVKINDRFCHQCTMDMSWKDVLNKMKTNLPENTDLKIQDLNSATNRKEKVFTSVALDEKIKETLRGKTIVEFPVLVF